MSDELTRRATDLHDAVLLTLRDLDVLVERIASAAPRIAGDAEQLMLFGVAALAQGYYSHLERLFERIARDLNGGPPSGPDWHRQLLRSMTLDKPGSRPPLISESLADRLGELLGFRHVFRNLYVLNLNAGRVRALAEQLTTSHRDVERSLEEFLAFLANMASL
jgi:hypothetical protein